MNAADYVPLRPPGGVPKQKLSIMIDALPVHGGDDADEWRRAKTRQLCGSRWNLAESDAPVHLDAARDECVQQCARRKGCRILDDVDVLPSSGPGADGAVGLNRPVPELPEAQPRSAARNRADVGDQWNRTGRRLEHHGCRLSRGRWRNGNGNQIVIQRKGRYPRGV